MVRAVRHGLAAAALLAAAPLALRAQVGQTTDVITGTVTGEEGHPLAEASVEATSVETQIMRTVRTDARGRYTILFPDGGGQYRVIVRMIGMTPVQRVVTRQADEDRLVVNVNLASTAQQLDEVVTRGRRPPTGLTPPSPGASELALSPDRLARLPIDAGDLAALATLAPGVVGLAGNDSTAAGFSVAGQRPSSNATTLDGLTFGASTIPQDAVRQTRVITSTYDVARGQFSGGLVAATTKSGTNQFTGTGTYNLRDPSLAVTGGNTFSQAFTQNQLSFGVGGPIVKNRFFWFASGQGRFRDDRLLSLVTAPPTTLERLGVSPDSAAHFLDIARANGIPASATPLTSRTVDDYSSIVRFDLLLSDAHTLTVRGDARSTVQDPTRIGSLSLVESGGRTRSSGGGVMATLSSRFGASVINELRTYVSGSSQRGTPELLLPQGRVQVASALNDSAESVATLVFGGNAGFNGGSSNRSVEVSEELSLLPGAAAHRIKLGLFTNITSTTADATNNRFGTFTFLSLGDLEAGQPATFTRTLVPTQRATTNRAFATYLGDTWRMNDALQLTYGARVDHSNFGGAPAYNPLVDSLYGLRTDRLPTETRVSPRVGFTWFIRSPDGPPSLTVRGGFGLFRSAVPTGLAAAAQSATGLVQSEAQLTCIGAAAPTPDWAAWAADPSTIPTTCAGASVPSLPSTSPTVAAFADNFQAARAWRGTLGAQRRFGFLTLGVEGSYSRGEAQSGFQDLNLGPARFTIADEGNRPVFADAGLIDPATGGVPLAASRLDTRFGQVLEIGSNLESRSSQLVFSASGIVTPGVTVQASYTWAHTRDESSAADFGARSGFASQTTAGNPNVPEWAYSDYDRRHQIIATVTWAMFSGVEFTTIGRLQSGAPYTPAVVGDVNGDGTRNDRAFIFDPATAPDPNVAAAMSRLLSGEASPAARECLASQLGAVASRNSCRSPWQPSLDVQLNVRPSWFGGERRLTMSLVTSNLLGGLDQLFHGADDLHGWGQYIRPDANLLYVQGFDQTTQRFTYQVNERFGSARSAANAIRVPFQVGIQLRYTLGAFNRNLFNGGGGGAGGGGRGGGGGGGGGGFRGLGGGFGRPGAGAAAGDAPAAGGANAAAAGDFSARLEQFMPNVVQKLLDIRIGLRLTDEQVAKLTVLADTFTVHRAAIGAELEKAIERGRKDAEPSRLLSTLRPKLQEGREEVRKTLEQAQAILTPEQWGQVPDEIKTPRGPGTGRGRGGRTPPR